MGGPPVHLQSGDHGALRTPTVAPFSRSLHKKPVWGQRGVEVGRGLERASTPYTQSNLPSRPLPSGRDGSRSDKLNEPGRKTCAESC